MRLTEPERASVHDLMAEAHRLATRPDGSVSVRAVPSHFLTLLSEVEGADPAFVGRYRDALALRGAAKVAADWRRTQRTRVGRRSDAPRFGGVRRRRPDGATEHVQVPLPAMTLNELRERKASLEKSRNTTSDQIAMYADLIAACEANGYTTAGQAMAAAS